jgi:hypothetical protein
MRSKHRNMDFGYRSVICSRTKKSHGKPGSTKRSQYTTIQFVPHGEQHSSTRNTNQLVLFREIIIVYCENNMKQKNTLYG